MQRISALFLALLLTLPLTACGRKAAPEAPAQDGDPAQTESPDPAPAEPEEPQPEPYVISSPTVDRGTVDGVT